MNIRLSTGDPVWYVAYGSNMRAARLACYIAGGRPRGASRTYLGCRDMSPPRRVVGVSLPGCLWFAGRSRVWGGGMAFYNPDADGELAARAYVLTFGQLSDVVAQERRRAVGHDLVLGHGRHRRWALSADGYETLMHVGDRDGMPMFTLTSLRNLEPAPPSAAYLRTILCGLAEAFAWTSRERAQYLHDAPGVSAAWSVRRIIALDDRR
ncbi:histone deacetylase [Mycobacterium sp. LTG2003]